MDTHKIILAAMTAAGAPKFSGKAARAFFGPIGLADGDVENNFASYVNRINTPAALVACFQAAARADYATTDKMVDYLGTSELVLTNRNPGVGALLRSIEQVTKSSVAVAARDGVVAGKGAEAMSDNDKDALADKVREVTYLLGITPRQLVMLKDVLATDADALDYIAGRIAARRA